MNMSYEQAMKGMTRNRREAEAAERKARAAKTPQGRLEWAQVADERRSLVAEFRDRAHALRTRREA